MTGNLKDMAGGALLLMFALAFAVGSLNNELGSSLNMGPGYFPLIVSGLLALVGISIVVPGLRSEPEAMGSVPFGGLVLVLIAPIAFLFTIDPLGLIPALFITGLLCALASAGVSLLRLAQVPSALPHLSRKREEIFVE
jgi:hypothetical protein